MTSIGGKVVKEQRLTTSPAIEAPERENDPGQVTGQARECESRRAGILLVIVGVVLMALATTETVAAEDGAPTPANLSAETNLESTD